MDKDHKMQWIGRSKGFFLSAQCIAIEKKNGALFRAPIAHLIAHGLELLLKYELIINGYSDNELKKVGHNLMEMWKLDECKNIRDLSLKHLDRAWKDAGESGRYECNFESSCEVALEESIKMLSRLHTAESNYAGRYPSISTETAPVPLILLDTFLPTVEDVLYKFGKEK